MHATPSSRCRVDGVEVDATIQHPFDLISTQVAYREELLFLNVFALPNASNTGFDCARAEQQPSA